MALTAEAYALMGDQVPRIQCTPERVGTAGPQALELAAIAGLILDPWQAWCLDQLLGEREDKYYNDVLGCMVPKSSAYESGLVVARQNGKGAVLEALELAWLFLTGARTIVHSAHEFATSNEHFMRVEALISDTPELKAELARGGIKLGNADRSITLRNGQRLLFKTRTKGATRGFTIYKLVIDEAMYLTLDAVKAMVFATSAAPDPQTVLTGSADGDRAAVHFGKVRSRGINKSDPRVFFAEWSANLCSMFCEKGPNGEFICRVHDNRASPTTWAKANPGLGRRLQIENIHSEFAGLEKAAFDVERLSHGDWPVEDEAWSVFTEEGWSSCFDPHSGAQRPMTFSIDTTPDKRYSAICVAADNGEGATHIEVTARDGVMDYRPGTDWVVRRAIEINKRTGSDSQWVIDKGQQAGSYWNELNNAGLRLVAPTAREYAQACGEFFADVMPIGGSTPKIRHIGQPELQSAIAGAVKRDLAEMWAWDKRNSATDISPLVAATNAVWGHKKRMHTSRPKPAALWG